jgi:hypothetical protein
MRQLLPLVSVVEVPSETSDTRARQLGTRGPHAT